MKQFLITVAGVFAGLMLFFIGIPIVIVAIVAASAAPTPMPGKVVLALDLRDGITDQSPSGLQALGASPLSVTSIVLGLKRAESDDRVRSLLIRLPDGGMEPAAADEISQAIRRFRKAGKTVYAHSQGLYASGVITSTYALGASANELWMQPGAPFEVTGISISDMFLKRAFDKYGVKAEFEQRAEYKNAVNPYLHDDYTEAHKEAQLSWMNAVLDSTLGAAAADRGLKPEVLRAAIVAGPYDAVQAASRGLITRLGQVEEIQDFVLEKAGKNSEFVDFEDYEPAPRRGGRGTGDSIAVVGAEGVIVTGSGGGGVSPFSEATVYSDDIAGAIHEAIDDDAVKAIVLRVSSPGGSDTASEQIAAAVRAAKKAGKPVVVSMGSYAASGGYWISADASAIVAQPTTLTGSIGVYGGKFAFGDLAAQHGVDFRQTTVGGDFASVGDLGQGFTPTQRAAYAAQIDRVYANFVNHVAAGRKLSPERVREIARGHVWTGVQAKELGLVDEIGGLQEAINKAKALAGIKGDARLILLPEAVSPVEALKQMLGVSTSGARTLAAAGWIMGDPKAKAVLDRVTEARLRAQGANVLAPSYVSGAR
jgi:protease-4